MKVTFSMDVRNRWTDNQFYAAGETADLADHQARRLVAAGQAAEATKRKKKTPANKRRKTPANKGSKT